MSATVTPISPAPAPGSEVIPFVYGDREVRTVTIDGEPWFVATDVAKALGYRNAPDMLRMVDDEDKGYAEVRTPGGPQRLGIINESGLYLAIFRSRAEHAKPFRRWITNEVIPSIRRRGGYLTPEATKAALADPDFIIRLATSLKEEQARSAALEERVAADAPMARFGRTLAASEGDLLVKQVAAAITAEGVTVSQPKLFGWLRAHGWLCRNRGRLWNAPTQWALEQGFVRQSVTLIATNHGDEERTTPRITTRGQQDLIDGFTSGRYQIEGDAA